MDMGTIPYGRSGCFSPSENVIFLNADVFCNSDVVACGAFYSNRCERHHERHEWHTWNVKAIQIKQL